MSTDTVKQQAIEIYELDKSLNKAERVELSRVHSLLVSQTISSVSTGFIIGVAVPFFARKKGQLINPAVPIASGIVGLSTAMLAEPFFYQRKAAELQKTHADEPNLSKMIKLTTDVYKTMPFPWASYFQKSSQDPNFRMKDPRTINDSSVLLQLDVDRIRAHFQEANNNSPQQPQRYPPSPMDRRRAAGPSDTINEQETSDTYDGFVESSSDDNAYSSSSTSLATPTATSTYTKSTWDILREEEQKEALKRYQDSQNNRGYSPSNYQYPPPQSSPSDSSVNGGDIFEVSFDEDGESNIKPSNLPDGTGPGTAWDRIRRGGR